MPVENYSWWKMMGLFTNLKCMVSMPLGEIKKSKNILHYTSTQICQYFNSNQFIRMQFFLDTTVPKKYFKRESKCLTIYNTAWKLSLFRVILVRIFAYLDWIRRDSVRMTKNTDQNNSKYRHFLRSLITNFCGKITFPFIFINCVVCIETFFLVI